MKKIASVLMCLLILASTSFAQAKQDTKKTADKTTTTQSKTASAPRMKKDGTRDKRFKSAKDTSAGSSTAHLKKSGTPDMRYRTNKAAKKS